MGWPKTLFGCFCTILWKNPNELFGQPNIKQVYSLEDDLMALLVMDWDGLSLEAGRPVGKQFNLETNGVLFIFVVLAPSTLPGT